MKIKNILAVLSLGMVSCVGLEQSPTTSYTDETFWTIEDNVRTALYLGYNQCWHQDYYFANNLLSDDVYGSRHSTNETSIVTGMANTSNGRFSDEWDKCYQELRTIHTALDAQDRMNIDETFKTRMLAELRLMRAFTYLRLVTWFGDVPFFTTNPTLPESRVVKVTPAATIKEFIHSELAEVAEILPKNTDIPESENGRYTRGTAVALNARAYLYDNDFENCAIWCDKLINSTEYGTYALESDYKKLFHDQSCCYGPESIMTIEFATLGGIDNIVRSWNNFNAFVPQSIGNKGVTTQSPTQELVDAYRKLDGSVADDTDYEKRDKRFEATIAFNGCTVDIPDAKGLGLIGSEGKGKGSYTCYTRAEDEKKQNDNERFDSYNGTQDRTATGYYTLKNYNADMVDSKGNTYKSLMEIRYADVLLMYAEVVNELYGKGATAEGCTLTATAALKEVHDRAFTDATKRDAAWTALMGKDFFDAIVDENAWELAGEGVRKFDLIRWNLLSEKIDEFKNEYTNAVYNGTYPQYVNYKYRTDNPMYIDMTSLVFGAKVGGEYENKSFFGAETSDKEQKNLKVNLPSISGGLNKAVKNRYLLPIASTTISTSNGKLHNSYGYSD